MVRFASEHVVLFLYLCYLVSKGATKSATPNRVSQSIVRARHTPYKRYFIMFVRSTPCSSCVCVILSVKTATKAATPDCIPQEIVRARYIRIRTDTVVRFASEYVVLFLCLFYLVSKDFHKGCYS